MEINKLLTPYNHTEGTTDRIKYIVIHYVGATSGAEANCKYFAGGNRNASAHYFVDHDGSVWQSVEDKDIAWHCTNKNQYCKNTNSIGIELCCRKSGNTWYFEAATVKAAVALTKELMAKYNVPLDRVWRHYDCTGKSCPEPFVRSQSDWEAFKAALVGKDDSKVSGWEQHDGWWYYYLNGVMQKNKWIHYKHHWYRIGPTGAMLIGWQKVPDNKGVDSWCYFDESKANIGAEWHERSDGVGFMEVWTTDD